MNIRFPYNPENFLNAWEPTSISKALLYGVRVTYWLLPISSATRMVYRPIPIGARRHNSFTEHEVYVTFFAKTWDCKIDWSITTLTTALCCLILALLFNYFPQYTQAWKMYNTFLKLTPFSLAEICQISDINAASIFRDTGNFLNYMASHFRRHFFMSLISEHHLSAIHA